MIKAFVVDDSPRPGTSDVMAVTPPVSIVWKMMRPQLERINGDRKRLMGELAALKKAMVPVVDEEFRLRKQIQVLGQEAGDGTDGGLKVLSQTADRLKGAREKTDVTVVAPEGEEYTGEFMEVLQNIAQEPREELEHPVVLEVVQPAILYHDELLRAGKAVIGIPVPPAKRDGGADPADGEEEDGGAQDEGVTLQESAE